MLSPKCDFYSYLFGFLSKNMALRLEAYPPDTTSCRGPTSGDCVTECRGDSSTARHLTNELESCISQQPNSSLAFAYRAKDCIFALPGELELHGPNFSSKFGSSHLLNVCNLCFVREDRGLRGRSDR